MLTKELAIFECDGDRITPDRLSRQKHGHYLEHAARMLRVYELGIGKTRQQLHQSIRGIFANEPDCPPQRIDAFCKLLEEEKISTFETDRRGKAAALRSQVFTLAAPCHPLVGRKDMLFEHCELEAKQEIAKKLGRASWEEVETELFADVFECNRLLSFKGYPSPEALLSRYNVAQVQVALFGARRLVIQARSDLQRIITQAKLARLLHDIRPPADPAKPDYTITLDGPASVLRETRRYGVNMARFVPALLSCRDWRMTAELVRFHRVCRLELSSNSGLRSEMPPPEEFDSSLEEAFAAKWGKERRNGWLMKRAGVILQKKQTVFVPDFSLEHEDGRKALLEIVGFWTPEYLRAKAEKLKLFADQQILLAVAESVSKDFAELPQTVIHFKKVLKPTDVIAALDPMSQRDK